MKLVPIQERFTGELQELAVANFWMDPAGNVVVVPAEGHCYWADDHDSDHETLIRMGWLKKSNGWSNVNGWGEFRLYSDKNLLTQKQLDKLADMHAVWGKKFRAERWAVR